MTASVTGATGGEGNGGLMGSVLFVAAAVTAGTGAGTDRLVEEAVASVLVLPARTRVVAVAEKVVVYAEIAIIHVGRRTRETVHALFSWRTLWKRDGGSDEWRGRRGPADSEH